jgi:hypothetical protein
MSFLADATVVALAHIQGLSEQQRELVLDLLRQPPRSIDRPWTESSARVPALAGREFAWPQEHPSDHRAVPSPHALISVYVPIASA